MAVRILVVDDEPRYLRLLEANLLTEDYKCSLPWMVRRPLNPSPPIRWI